MNKSKNEPKFSIAAIDIGNSNIKVLIDYQKFSTNYDSDWTKRVFDYLGKNLPKDGFLSISSVQPKRYEQLRKTINDKYKVLTANELLNQQKIIDFSAIEGIGNDRILGLIGGLSKYQAPLITIDCGTAITINVLDKSLKCLGGVIFSGVETQLEALSVKTAQLKKVDLYLEDDIIGRKTESALRNGILKGAAGSIIFIVDNIINQYFINSEINLIITGGTSKLILPVLEKSHLKINYEETLVLDGMKHITETYLWNKFC